MRVIYCRLYSLLVVGLAWLLVAAFGLGTIPGLLLLGTGGAAFARKHRRLMDLAAGVLLIGMALSVGIDAAQALM